MKINYLNIINLKTGDKVKTIVPIDLKNYQYGIIEKYNKDDDGILW